MEIKKEKTPNVEVEDFFLDCAEHQYTFKKHLGVVGKLNLNHKSLVRQNCFSFISINQWRIVADVFYFLTLPTRPRKNYFKFKAVFLFDAKRKAA